MTLTKLIESMTVASSPSWTTRWTTFIGGWWKSSPMATPSSWGNTRTLAPRASAKLVRLWRTDLLPLLRMSHALAVAVAACLLLVGSIEAASQAQHKKKTSTKPKAIPCRTGCTPETGAPEITSITPDDEAAQRDLSVLARALRNAAPGSYERLAVFARANTTNVWGARAALALGFDDYNKNHAPQGLAWFNKAKADTLLSDYVLYCNAQALRTLKRNPEALAALESVQHDNPATPMKEQLLEALGPVAVDTGHPQVAIDALDGYPSTSAKPALLLIRAQAYRSAHQIDRAAKDYQTLFYKFPLSDEAKAAGTALPQITKLLGKEYPYPGVELQEQRAQAFFDAHKWKEHRHELEKCITMLHDPENPHRQLAQLRVAEARVQLKASPSLVSSLTVADFDVDAERLYELSQIYRNDKRETEMLSAIEQLAKKYPMSKWNEEGLMAAGNYYWVGLDRTKAAAYYQRVLDNFAAGKYAFNCEWRVAWVAYLNQQADTTAKLAAFLRKYPVSANAPDALYWLGPSADAAG